MIKTLMVATAAALTLVAQAQAVTVVQWSFEGAAAPAASTAWTGIAPSTGTGSASGVHANPNSVWSTPAGNGSARSISANNWSVGDYWQFGFSSAGYTGLTLSFDQTSSGTGPRDFTLAWSNNGSSFTPFSSYVVLANASPAWSAGSSAPAYTFNFDLSAVTALDNQASVLVRLIDASTFSAGGGTVAGGGTNRVDNFTVNLSPVPEAGTAAMLLAGLAAVGMAARRSSSAR